MNFPVFNGPFVPVSSIASQTVLDNVARCLSPGPIYDGPPIDRESMPSPLANCPDWPINDAWRDFAFAPVTFRSLTVDIDPSPDIDIVL